MAKIFISYARSDAAFASRLVDQLRQANLDVWFDTERAHPVHGWADRLRHALEEARLVLCVVSPASHESPQFADQITHALDTRKPILVILPAEPTQTLIPKSLCLYDRFDFSTEYEAALQSLIDHVIWRLSPRLNSVWNALSQMIDDPHSILAEDDTLAPLDETLFDALYDDVQSDAALILSDELAHLTPEGESSHELPEVESRLDPTVVPIKSPSPATHFVEQLFDRLEGQRICPELLNYLDEQSIYLFNASQRAFSDPSSPPLEWYHINSTVRHTLQGEEVVAFSISRRPITYAQYQVFIHDGGYSDKRWWVDWRHRHSNYGYWEYDSATRQPIFDFQMIVADQPVVNVSWYEAMAFCRWLGAKLALHVQLPTPAEWAYSQLGRHIVYEHTTPDGDPVPPVNASLESLAAQRTPDGSVWEWCLAPVPTVIEGARHRHNAIREPILKLPLCRDNAESLMAYDAEPPDGHRPDIGFRVMSTLTLLR